MRIAVIGAGAVGGYCAARLVQGGHEVIALDVGEHLAAIRTHGLRIETPDDSFVVNLSATDDPASVGTVDLVIVAVQSHQTAMIAPTIQSLLGPNTLVLPLQNNVTNPEILASALGTDSVLAAAIFIASSRPEAGLVRQLSSGVQVYIGERDSRESDRTRELARLLSEAGLPALSTGSVRKEMWTKFTFVIGFGLTAPLRASAAEILDLEETRAFHWRLINEVALVSAHSGVPLSDEDLNGIVDSTRFYGGYLPSSVQEIDEGRADELEFMLQTVIDLGRRVDVPTPTAEATLAFTRFPNLRNKQLTSVG